MSDLICKKCKQTFNCLFTAANGISYRQPNRKYCYICKPIVIRTDINNVSKYKICSKCNRELKNTAEFFNMNTWTLKTQFSCRECENKYHENRRVEIKNKAFEIIGYNYCKLCGYKAYNGSLSFHHLNPSKKELSIADASFKTLETEVPKCILVCEVCHAEIHAGLHPTILNLILSTTQRLVRERIKKLDIKQQCVNYRGGQCVKCGYNKCLRALEFHHTDPDNKDFYLAQKRILDIEKLKPELDKCIVICRNCHFEEHERIRSFKLTKISQIEILDN